jgi:hypothetical protein
VDVIGQDVALFHSVHESDTGDIEDCNIHKPGTNVIVITFLKIAYTVVSHVNVMVSKADCADGSVFHQIKSRPILDAV